MSGRNRPSSTMARAGSAQLDQSRTGDHVIWRFVVMTKRELISQRSDKRYIRRDARGRFTSSQVDVASSLSADRRRDAKTAVSKGQGDRGDQRRPN
jgi:hypothetical protein